MDLSGLLNGAEHVDYGDGQESSVVMDHPQSHHSLDAAASPQAEGGPSSMQMQGQDHPLDTSNYPHHTTTTTSDSTPTLSSSSSLPLQNNHHPPPATSSTTTTTTNSAPIPDSHSDSHSNALSSHPIASISPPHIQAGLVASVSSLIAPGAGKKVSCVLFPLFISQFLSLSSLLVALCPTAGTAWRGSFLYSYADSVFSSSTSFFHYHHRQ